MNLPTPLKPEYFNYPKAAKNAGLGPDQLAAVVRLFELDYPNDLMLRELHILRACEAIAEGMMTLPELLEEPGGMAA